jgi:tetratricopeptide (TPR) repeat protein
MPRPSPTLCLDKSSRKSPVTDPAHLDVHAIRSSRPSQPWLGQVPRLVLSRLLDSRVPPIQIALVVFLVALALRLIHLHAYAATAFFKHPLFDAAYYDETARSIAAGNWLGNTPFFMGPLYSYFLGLLYAVSGGSRYFALVIQAVTGSATCVLTYLLGRQSFSELIGIVGALFLAFYGIVIYYDGLLLMESLVLFLNMLSLLLIVSGIQRRGWYHFLLAGCCIGLSALGRASVLLFAAGICLWLLLTSYASGARRLLHVALLSLGIGLCIAPVALRNYHLEPDLVPVSANGGLNFYIGNGPGATGTFRVSEVPSLAPGELTGKFEAEMSSRRSMTYAEVSDWWYDRTLSFLRTHPRIFLSNMLWKIQLFWNAFEIPQIEWYAAQRQQSPVLSKPLVSTQLILPLAVAGILCGLQVSRRMAPFYLYLGLQTLATSLFFVTARYRVTVLPVLSLFAASAVTWIVRQAMNRRMLRLGGCAALVGLLFWALGAGRLSLNVAELERWNLVNSGAVYASDASGLTAGLRLLEEAVLTYPDDRDSHIYYGIALRNAGRLEESLEQFEHAYALDPGSPVVLFQIGKARAALGSDSLAIAAFMAAIATAPLYEDAHEHLAFVYASQGRYSEALKEFSTAVEIDPTDSPLRVNLGVTYGKMGMKWEAIGQFEKALQYDKANWKAMYDLGVALSQLGRWAEARRLLDDVLEHDPANSAARDALSAIPE